MEVIVHSETNVRELVERKKRKREKRKGEYDTVGLQDTHGETKISSKTDDDLMANRTVDDGNDGDGDALSQKADRKRKRKKKTRTRKENDDGSIESTKCHEVAMTNLKRKKKHKKENNYKDDSPAVQQDISDSEDASKGKTQKIKIVGYGSKSMQDEVECFAKGKKKKMKSVENDPTSNESGKKVRFSSENEVFTLPSDLDTGNKIETENGNLLRGKRFTSEEDEILKEAVYKYVEEHNLGDEGLNMILNSRQYPSKVKGCWKEIGSAIPYRPYTASYFRAQVLFRRSSDKKWTQEEYDLIRKYHAEHGNHWRALADLLGKHTRHVQNAWIRIKLPDLKKGNWSQEEYQKLFDLVNTDLQVKVSEEKRSRCGMLRDNISWTAISDRLSTRDVTACCLKWYKKLTSPMVAEGVWADVDDYRLIGALYDLDATCMEDVDWDGLLDDRTGDVCRKRWNQMVLHIGRHGNMSFAEQVDVLTHRYCPHLLEAREAWDNKPRVP